MPIEKVPVSTLIKPKTKRLQRESFWIDQLQTVIPNGLNIQHDNQIIPFVATYNTTAKNASVIVKRLYNELQDEFPNVEKVPVKELLSNKYATERRKFIHSDRTASVKHGSPYLGSDTTYFSITDVHGNACSFINSNFMGFGTGLVPEGCGFTLQNRGYGFSLDPNHPNSLKPGKRPYHTIIPAMVTSQDSGELLCSYGVMGGFMQPQGHVQVLMNMVEFGMNPQQAIDAPRFCVGGGYGCGSVISLEEGIPEETIRVLKGKGHNVKGPLIGYDRSLFGRGHIITKGDWWRGDKSSCSDVWWGGCDPRTDSSTVGY